MKFVCDRCQTRYSIADDKVRQKILKIRCKTCENVITVRDASATAAAPPPPPMSRPPMGPVAVPEWYVAINGSQTGPHSRQDAARRVIACGPVEEIYIWKDGFDGWKDPKDVPPIAQEMSALRSRSQPPLPSLGRSAMSPPPSDGKVSLGRIVPSRAVIPVAAGRGQSAALATKPAPLSPAGPMIDEEGFEQEDRTQIQPLDTALMMAEGSTAMGSRAPSAVPTAAPIPSWPSAKAQLPAAARVSLPMAMGASSSPPPQAFGTLFEDIGLTPPGTPVGAAAGGVFFPPGQISAPATSAESGLSKLAGLPGFLGRHPALKFVTAGAVVVGLLIAAAIVTIRGPADNRVVAPGELSSPAPVAMDDDPEKRAREAAEARFRSTVGGADEAPPAQKLAINIGPERTHARRLLPRPSTSRPALAPQAVAPPPVAAMTAEQEAVSKRFGQGERRVASVSSVAHVPTRAEARTPVSEGDLHSVVTRKENQTALKICYDRALRRDQRLRQGRIDVTVSVGASGAVKSVMVSAPPEFASVESCIRTSVRRWAFPTNTEEYATTFPLILQAGQ